MLSSFSFIVPVIKRGYEVDTPYERIEPILLLPSTYVHELSHALVTRALYRYDDLKIVLYLSGGGRTTSIVGGPSTQLGNFLGDRLSTIAITGAGPIADCISAFACHRFANQFDRTGSLFIMVKVAAVVPLTFTLIYAVKGLWSKHTVDGACNDFYRLKQQGVHPIFPAVGISALLLLIFLDIFKGKMGAWS